MAPRPHSLASLLIPCLLLGMLGLLPAPARSDVLETTDGLRLEGAVTRDEAGNYLLETGGTQVVLAETRVVTWTPGDGPRTRLERRAAALPDADAAGLFRLAVEAEAAGLPDVARAAYARIIAVQPDHAAARRALEHEQVDGVWMDADAARRKRGLVLYRGRWMLPAEVEVSARAEVSEMAVPSDDARTRAVIRTLASGTEPLQRAARLALAGAPRDRRLRAALSTLYDATPAVRAISARLLGEWGDEVALKPLILSGARDVDAGARREAVLAAASFGHDDTAVPFVRALGSAHPQLVANAAGALAGLGDERAVSYLVKRLSSHGHSTRNFVAFLNQVSYVRDYDVEIAQASNIANPDVSTIQEGVILDVRVMDAAYEKTWVESVIVDSISQIVGRPFRNKGDVLAWYAAHRDEYPGFPDREGARPERRRPGRVIGAH